VIDATKGIRDFIREQIESQILPHLVGIRLTVIQNKIVSPSAGEIVIVILNRPNTHWKRFKLLLAGWLLR
jgi:hypothetical protein